MAEGVPPREAFSENTNILQEELDFAFECALDHRKKKSKEVVSKGEKGQNNLREKSRSAEVDEAQETSQSSFSVDLADSDIDEVLAESTEIIWGAKVTIKSDFFLGSTEYSARNSVTGESMTSYDPTPPSRNQVIGSTPAYLEHLKAQSEKIEQLVPIFTLDDLNQSCNMYWNYPRVVLDFNMFEELMVPIIPNGAVKKLICKEGRGEKLMAGDNVLINYYIYVEGCPNCMESNKRKRTPHSFVLGKKRGGIPVIDLGTLSMRVKEVSAFLATPEYGTPNATGDSWIPPNKRVLCIIEVLSRLCSPDNNSSIINLVPVERKLLRFEQIYDFSIKRKSDANKDFAKEKNARALRKYLQAATCLQDATPNSDPQQERKTELLHTLFTSIAICGIRTNQMNIAIEFSQKSIELPIADEEKVNDYFRCARVYYQDKQWRMAKTFLETALPLLQGSEMENEARNMWTTIEDKISDSEKAGNGSSSSSTSTLYSATSESPEPRTKGKKKRSSSICGGLGFLSRRSSESSSK